MILIIDNYDSFVYNLYQYIGQINSEVIVYRNDSITIEEIKKIKPSHIVLSPGPGHPKDSGVCLKIIDEFKRQIPILGVCLGHQAIGLQMNCKIGYADEIIHGKRDKIRILNNDTIFKGINDLEGARYHSLIVENEDLSSKLEIIAKTDNDEIMAIKYKNYHMYGLQFHPESILTTDGIKIIENFLKVGY